MAALQEDHIRVSIKRIGITPDQLPADLVETNKYTPKPANMDKWMERTGGINGEEKGLELDALSNNMIREIFIKELEPYLDEDIYTEFARESYVRKLALEALQEDFDKILDELVQEYAGQIEINQDFDIYQVAKDRRSSIPIGDACDSDIDDEIKETAKNYLNI